MRALAAVADLNLRTGGPRRGAHHHRRGLYRRRRRQLVRPGGRRGGLPGAGDLRRPGRRSSQVALPRRGGRGGGARAGTAWTRSGSAGDSWPSAHPSRSGARRRGSSSSGRTARRSGCWATRSWRSGWPRRPACRSSRGAADRSTTSRRPLKAAEQLGYPVLLKASAGGGGRGIRLVHEAADLAAALTSARSEAELAFGDPAVFLEAFVPAARHVEVQVDRRPLRHRLGGGRARLQHPAAQSEGHRGVVLDRARPGDRGSRSAPPPCGWPPRPDTATPGPSSSSSTRPPGEFLFMEVNTRLQVEHPVTEVTTGLDLVKLQLHVACGGRLEGEPAAGAGARRRGPAVRRGPRAGLRARARAARPAAPAHRPGHPGRLRCPGGRRHRAPSSTRMIAKIIAWGARPRRGARPAAPRAGPEHRRRRGRHHQPVVPAVAARPAGGPRRAGSTTAGWTGSPPPAATCPPPDPVALLSAAVEAYDADHAAGQAAFHAGAARGRPELPGEGGTRVQLRYRGVSYHLDVYRTGPGTYRVKHGDVGRRPGRRTARRVRAAHRVRRPQPPHPRGGPERQLPHRRRRRRPTRSSATTAGWCAPGWPAFVVSRAGAPGRPGRRGRPPSPCWRA